MSGKRDSPLAGLKQDAYTGTNRCLPCTLVNATLAVALAVIVGSITPELGVVVIIVSALAIYFRGYLIPGTPTLTKRYLPQRVLALFDKSPVSTGVVEQNIDKHERSSADEDDLIDPVEYLLAVEVVELCEDESDLCFTDEFRARVDSALEEVAVGVDDSPDGIPIGLQGDNGLQTIGGMFGVDSEEVTIEHRGYPAITVNHQVHRWPSTSALAIDVATYRALETFRDGWTGVPRHQRVNILRSLRTFQRSCPRCEGEVVTGQETIESCCREYEIIAVQCDNCGARILELDPDQFE